MVPHRPRDGENGSHRLVHWRTIGLKSWKKKSNRQLGLARKNANDFAGLRVLSGSKVAVLAAKPQVVTTGHNGSRAC